MNQTGAAVVANPLFPVFLKLEGRRVLIVGGGKVALEKLNTLLRNAPGARITLVAPEICREIQDLACDNVPISLLQRGYNSADLEQAAIVVVAVNNRDLATAIRRDAAEQRLLVNVADTPDLCDFYLGAIMQRGHLKIAISTNGQSPTLARRLKEVLEDGIPAEFDDLLQSVHQLRNRLVGDFSNKVRQLNELTIGLVANGGITLQKKNERFWRKVAYSCITGLALLFAGNVLARYLTVEEIGHSLAEVYARTPDTFYWMLLTGFVAQMVDGALGMGYGVTCTAVLLSVGVPLPSISGGIHTAEMFSSAASGFSHYKFGNINKKLFKAMLIPAVVGSFAGAFILCVWGQQYTGYFKPMMALYTLLLGVKILFSAFKSQQNKEKVKKVGWLGFFGGFLDAIGGGGWGPLVTSTLLSKGKSPRYVTGTVSLTEFFVTLVSALTFFVLLGMSHWQVVAGLISGGLIAAPIAARLSGLLPRRTGFLAIGALIIIWSLTMLFR